MYEYPYVRVGLCLCGRTYLIEEFMLYIRIIYIYEKKIILAKRKRFQKRYR